jgi:hypothetical protein
MEDYFISDPHFGHKLVSQLRGFDDPKAHDQFLLKAWIDTFPADQHVRLWVLGDNYVGGPNAEDHALGQLCYLKKQLLEKKNSVLELHGILGNHDSAHPMHSKAFKQVKRFYLAYDSVQMAACIKMAGHRVMMNHFPYDGDHLDEERGEQFRLRDLGAPLLHGHTHSSQQISYSQQGSLQICLSVEACPSFQPVRRTIVEKIVKQYV